MNESYGLSEAGKRRLRMKYVRWIAVALVLGAVILYGLYDDSIIRSVVGEFWLVVPVVVVMVTLKGVRSIMGLGSYAVELNDAWVGETWKERRGVVLAHDRIDRIEEDDTGLFVIGTKAISALHAPCDLERFEDFRDHLGRIHGITARPPRAWWQKHPLLFLILCVSLFSVFGSSLNPWFALAAGALEVALLVWWMIVNWNMFGRGISRGYQIACLWLIFFTCFRVLYVLVLLHR